LARVIAGRMVVSCRASIDCPAPGDPRRRILWSGRGAALGRVAMHAKRVTLGKASVS
jgi:hypothetical protein